MLLVGVEAERRYMWQIERNILPDYALGSLASSYVMYVVGS